MWRVFDSFIFSSFRVLGWHHQESAVCDETQRWDYHSARRAGRLVRQIDLFHLNKIMSLSIQWRYWVIYCIPIGSNFLDLWLADQHSCVVIGWPILLCCDWLTNIRVAYVIDWPIFLCFESQTYIRVLWLADLHSCVSNRWPIFVCCDWQTFLCCGWLTYIIVFRLADLYFCLGHVCFNRSPNGRTYIAI